MPYQFRICLESANCIQIFTIIIWDFLFEIVLIRFFMFHYFNYMYILRMYNIRKLSYILFFYLLKNTRGKLNVYKLGFSLSFLSSYLFYSSLVEEKRKKKRLEGNFPLSSAGLIARQMTNFRQ